MEHQIYVLLCTETTPSNPPVVQPKSSCDVHLLRSLWIVAATVVGYCVCQIIWTGEYYIGTSSSYYGGTRFRGVVQRIYLISHVENGLFLSFSTCLPLLKWTHSWSFTFVRKLWWHSPRTTKMVLDSKVRAKITIMLKIKKVTKSFLS